MPLNKPLSIFVKPQVDLSQYMRPSPPRSWMAIATTWLGIFLTLSLTRWINHYLLIIPALLLVGAMQHRFFTIYHEAFHCTLFSNRQLNDWAGKWLAAYPSLVAYESARKRHLAHHAFATTAEDPERVSHIQDWRTMLSLMFPWPGLAWSVLSEFGLVAKHGVAAPEGRQSWDSVEQTKKGEIVYILLLQTALLALLLGLFGMWSGLYYVAFFAVSPFFTQVRQWGEHYGKAHGQQADPRYVHISPNFIERFFFSPMNFNYHAAHHLYPRVPYIHLPAVQRLIEKEAIAVIQRTGYIRLFLKEIVW
ncbi:MAG: hypothetical protein HOP18_02575 [Deltaproteobacteria bacterium]|nr:hypothetical protein [Deltaproteobacteria bacterium]